MDGSVDRSGFARELDALRGELLASIGPDDLAHLRKMERWGRAAAVAGYATAWLVPNPISAALIALGNTTRWAILMHHVGHRGYDRVPGVPERYTSRGFARGWRRAVDWLDWMDPEAWRFEHNVLHHGRTGELEDPDLVEENVDWFRRAKLPRVVSWLVIAFFVCTWKLTYYAPNTAAILSWARRRKQGGARRSFREDVDRAAIFDPRTGEGRGFWARNVLPYGVVRFLLLPALFLPLGWWAAFSVLANSVLAELLANAHSFFLIVPNHAGDDLYRFDGRAPDKQTYYLRQVIGSVDYATGSDLVDFLQGGLNYQIEHHLFPDLPLLAYRRCQPRVRAICEKYGVPYRQEPISRRVGQLFGIVMGTSSMRRARREADEIPVGGFDPARQRRVWG